MQVAAAMTRKVVTVAPKAPLSEAEALMHRGRFRHLPVTVDGRLIGVVSERDVRPPPGFDRDTQLAFRSRTVASVMRSPAITVAAEDPLEEAARLLYDNKIGCLPVLRAEELVGIITSSDVFHTYMRITGLLEPSSRVELRAGDLPASLRAIAEVADQYHASITTILTERASESPERTLVVRFATLQGPRLVAALRERGVEVLSPGGLEG